MTSSQALDYLGNLEVISDYEEECLSNLQSPKICLKHLLNSNGPNSDVDADNENTVTAYTSNLSGNQLLISAVLEKKCPIGKVIVGQSEDTATKAPVHDKSKTTKERHFTTREQMDSSNI